MLYDLKNQGHNIHCVLFHYEQRHAKELDYAKRHCDRLKVGFTVLIIPQLRGSELTDGTGGVVIPNRNAIMLSHAVNLAVAAKADTITYACNADDEAVFPDCRMAFVQTFNNLLMMTEIQIEVCAPYIDKKKWWIAGLARELGVPIEDTWSCYRNGKEPCGECPACKKRIEAIGRRNVNPTGQAGYSTWAICR